LRYTTHQNGELLSIYHGIEGGWSKRRMHETVSINANDADAPSTLHHIAEATKKLFANRRFMWHANKSVPADLLDPNKRLPSKPHGRNDFSGIHNIALLSAINPTPDHLRFLEMMGGLTPAEIRTALYFQSAYQVMMRSSLRDPDNGDAKVVVVPDLPLAKYVEALFQRCRIRRLDTELPIQPVRKKRGRPQQHSSTKERVSAHRAKARALRRQILMEQEALSFAHDAVDAKASCNDNTWQYISLFVTEVPLTGTVYLYKYSSEPAFYHTWHDFAGFIALLHDYYKRTALAKDDIGLISPAIFNPNKSVSKRRGTENIEYLRHIWPWSLLRVQPCLTSAWRRSLEESEGVSSRVPLVALDSVCISRLPLANGVTAAALRYPSMRTLLRCSRQRRRFSPLSPDQQENVGHHCPTRVPNEEVDQ
jgi:hypothetical protein